MATRGKRPRKKTTLAFIIISGFKVSLTVRGRITVGLKTGIDYFISGGLALADDLSQPAGLSHHL